MANRKASYPATKPEGGNIGASDKSVQVIHEATQDILAAPDGAVLIHATNCLGVWGSGIAAAFKDHYPQAFNLHHKYCLETRKRKDAAFLAGSCQLVEPQQGDCKAATAVTTKPRKSPPGTRSNHWIACLFTSIGYGTKPSPPHFIPMSTTTEILEHSRSALQDLRDTVEGLRKSFPTGHVKRPGKLFMCQINNGRFRVPWEDTRKIVETVFDGFEGGITVVIRPGEVPKVKKTQGKPSRILRGTRSGSYEGVKKLSRGVTRKTSSLAARS